MAEQQIEMLFAKSSSDSSIGFYDTDIEEYLNSDSTSSDESNAPDDMLHPADHDVLSPILQLLLHGRRGERSNDYLGVIHRYSDSEFKQHFRLSRHTVYGLIDRLAESNFLPTHGSGSDKISAEISFLITVWYLGNTEPLRTMSDRFDVSLSSVWRILRRVVASLLSLMDEVVTWPTGQRVTEVSNAFMEKRRIPNCIGAIDGSHTPINAPAEFQRDFVNRKGFHSIILQVVVTADMKFTNLFCGEPGSLHDARVWRRSTLFREAELHPEVVFPGRTFLIGDSAYPNMPYLIPPFRDNGHLTPQQGEFNFIHSSTRMAVENAFGILKGRFQRLKRFELLIIEDVINMTLACCVLHNLCLDNNDEVGCDSNADEDWGDNSDDNELAFGENWTNDRRAELIRELFPLAVPDRLVPQR